jgi:hypothetical protein
LSGGYAAHASAWFPFTSISPAGLTSSIQKKGAASSSALRRKAERLQSRLAKHGYPVASVPKIIVFLNKCDMVDDKDMIDLVEEEIRELLTKQGFDGANAPVIRGSGLKALESKDNTDEWAVIVIERSKGAYLSLFIFINPISLPSYVGKPSELTNTLVCKPKSSPLNTTGPIYFAMRIVNGSI